MGIQDPNQTNEGSGLYMNLGKDPKLHIKSITMLIAHMASSPILPLMVHRKSVQACYHAKQSLKYLIYSLWKLCKLFY